MGKWRRLSTEWLWKEGLSEEVTLRRDRNDEKESVRNSLRGIANSMCKAPEMGLSVVGLRNGRERGRT